jgi:hypothetical protein
MSDNITSVLIATTRRQATGANSTKLPRAVRPARQLERVRAAESRLANAATLFFSVLMPLRPQSSVPPSARPATSPATSPASAGSRKWAAYTSSSGASDIPPRHRQRGTRVNQRADRITLLPAILPTKKRPGSRTRPAHPTQQAG